jgi:ATF/CREB family transcription factor
MDTPSNYLVAEKFLAAEHNPFEQSFAIRPSSSSAPGGNGTETPKPALPSVMEMFTPGGTNQYEQFNFAESLRHGPLSPNLLSGPQGPLPFDPANFRTGLTPNESNIRTGLTPGNTPGFPMLPTPGTAALLGAYTPNTAAAISSMQSTTFPTVAPFPAAQAAARPADVFGESQAANGLVFLAQTSQQQQQQIQATQNIGPAAGTREDVKRIAANNAKANSFKEKDEPVATGKSQRTRKGNKEEITPSKDNAKKLKTKNTPETDDEKRKNFLERNRQGIDSTFRFPVSLSLFFYCWNRS